MRGIKKRIIPFLLTLLIVFSFKPFTVKAEGATYTANDEESLLAAISNAADGDTIVLDNYIYLSSNLEITKNITLLLNDHSIGCMDSDASAVITISGCQVTIKGYGMIDNDVDSQYAILVTEGATDTILNLDNINCPTTLATYDDPSTSATVTVNITGKSSFSGSPMFAVNGGTIAAYDGTYTESPEAYLGENTDLIDNGEGYSGPRYEVRSSIISDTFKQILTDGKLVIPSVAPSDDMEAIKYAFAALFPYQTEYDQFYPQPIDGNIYDIYYYGDGVEETHRVEAVFTGSVDNIALQKAKEYAKNVPADDPDNPWGATFRIVDMEVINMWASGFNPDAKSSKYLMGMANYSGELKKYLGNENIDFKVVYVGAGEDTDLFTVSCGDGAVSINDVICATPDLNIIARAEHVIYVPDETATTKDALIEAAQKRINDYLGDSSKVVLSYGGAFNTLTDIQGYYSDEDYRKYMLETIGLTSAPADYFIATVNGHQFKLLIVPDSSKMLTPTYKTVDAVSKVTISSGSSEIPLDCGIRASKLTSGAAYEDIISKLNVDDNITFDLKIYSFSNDKNISSISKDKFTVSIPLTDELKGKNLKAYYVDNDGKVTTYDAEIVDGNAVFYTDHFSIYTIAEEVSEATTEATTEASTQAETKPLESPATGDSTNIILLFGLLLLSVAGIIVVKKRTSR